MSRLRIASRLLTRHSRSRENPVAPVSRSRVAHLDYDGGRDGYDVRCAERRLATNFGWPGPLTPWRAVRCKRQDDGEA